MCKIVYMLTLWPHTINWCIGVTRLTLNSIFSFFFFLEKQKKDMIKLVIEMVLHENLKFMNEVK